MIISESQLKFRQVQLRSIQMLFLEILGHLVVAYVDRFIKRRKIFLPLRVYLFFQDLRKKGQPI